MKKSIFIILLHFSLLAQGYDVIKIKDGKIKVRIEAVSRCHVSDYDLIASELTRELYERQRIIATIEPLPVSQIEFKGGSSGNLLLLDYKYSHEMLNKEFELPISNIRKPSIAGVFICKDGDDKASCAAKKIQSFDKMISEHEIPAEAVDLETGKIFTKIPELSKQEDRIYYFNPVVVAENEVRVFSKIKDAKQYKNALSKQVPNDIVGVGYATNGIDILSSIDLKVIDGVLVISLPYNDSDKCYGDS